MFFNYNFFYDKLSSTLNFEWYADADQSCQVAIYVYKNGERIFQQWYTKSYRFNYHIDINDEKDSYHLGVFIKFASGEIKNFLTYKITPTILCIDIDIDVETIKGLDSLNKVEKYITSLTLETGLTKEELFVNLVENDYNFLNLIFADYLFISYVLLTINRDGNWINVPKSLGLINEAYFPFITLKMEEWFINGMITEFTKNFVYALKLIYENKLNEACYLMHRCELPNHYYFPAYFKGINTFNDTINIDNEKFPYSIGKNKFSKASNITFIFSANKTYFDRFFQSSLDSILEYTKDFNVGIGLVNFNDNELIEAESIMQSYTEKFGIEFSYQVFLTNVHEKTLSACSRFLIAEELMKQGHNECLIVDIDIHFNEFSKDYLHEIRQKNLIGLLIKNHDKRLIPWAAIAAAATYLPKGDISQFLINHINNYIKCNYNPEYSWWLDQNALFSGYNYLRSMFPFYSIQTTHNFAKSLLSKNDSQELINWKRNLSRTYN